MEDGSQEHTGSELYIIKVSPVSELQSYLLVTPQGCQRPSKTTAGVQAQAPSRSFLGAPRSFKAPPSEGEILKKVVFAAPKAPRKILMYSFGNFCKFVNKKH